MGRPARRTLLPGVSGSGSPPEIRADSRRVIAKARRRAALRDVFDFLLLAVVDTLFLRWPHAHVPFLDRADTMLLLASINLLMLVWIASARALPRWRARRVAASWRPAERNQLINRLKY